jgi:glyoxylase-like metal-dependent hydrolase (beta-lactamase superfamily II)
MKIIPLSEGTFTVDQTKKFVPFNPEKDQLKDRSRGSLLVEIQPFCVITKTEIIILDTGLGFVDESGEMQIRQNLAKHGIAQSDVTIVLLSHLHKDHAGGIAEPGKKELSFRNASYYINRQEWDYAFQKGAPSYSVEDFALLADNNQLHFISEAGTIHEQINYWVTGGHSPFHQVFMITEGSEKAFYGGDVAPQMMQMKNRFKAKYDFDGHKSSELRQEWKKQAESGHWTFLFYHDIKQPVVKF